ncbi:MAG: DUF4124 domain-containing protein [Pseudomonadota bacterium]
MPPACCPRPLLWIALAACLLAGPAQAQYTWKDSKGQLHASDQPPPRDIPDKNIIKRPGPPRPAAAVAAAASAPAAASAARPAAVSAPVDPELQQRRARAEQEAKAKVQADEQRLAGQRAENCQRARAHLATLDSGTRLVRIDARGERVVVDDAARAQEAAQARGVIASECR